METLTVTKLPYHEFDKLVQEKLGIVNFECVAEFELNNDSDYLWEGVYGAPCYTRYKPDTPREQIEKWYSNSIQEVEEMRIGKGRTGPYQILEWLCLNKYIEPGNYLIQVSW